MNIKVEGNTFEAMPNEENKSVIAGQRVGGLGTLILAFPMDIPELPAQQHFLELETEKTTQQAKTIPRIRRSSLALHPLGSYHF
jgi:hypothetical protein